MNSSTIALDVDLNRVHAFSSTEGRVCYNAPDWPWDALWRHDKILVEVASPVDTSKSDAEAYNRRKWAIGNSFLVGQLLHAAALKGQTEKILVSPSNEWTMKHPEKQRDIVAGCDGQDNHDIRACRAMLVYHGYNPQKWVPIISYYQNLSTKGCKARK